jgi:DNA-directed RNA polymerase specialized sigma24 family protein
MKTSGQVWRNVDDRLREAVEEHCTAPQVQVLELWLGGLGYKRLAIELGIGRDAARDRLQRTLHKLQRKLAEDGLDLETLLPS